MNEWSRDWVGLYFIEEERRKKGCKCLFWLKKRGKTWPTGDEKVREKLELLKSQEGIPCVNTDDIMKAIKAEACGF